jgi:hypothetical protein
LLENKGSLSAPDHIMNGRLTVDDAGEMEGTRDIFLLPAETSDLISTTDLNGKQEHQFVVAKRKRKYRL